MVPIDPGKSGRKPLAAAVAAAAAAGALLGTLSAPYLRADAGPAPARAAGRAPRVCEAQAGANGRARILGAAPMFQTAGLAVPDHEALNPASDHYDPGRARPMLTPLEIFLQEPRDPTWAAPVESWMSKHLASDLAAMVPAARDVTVECRTASCLIKYTGSPEVSRQVKALYLALYVAAETDFIADGRILAILGGSAGPYGEVPRSDQSAFMQRMDDLRAALISQLDRKPHRVNAFPRELWPKE